MDWTLSDLVLLGSPMADSRTQPALVRMDPCPVRQDVVRCTVVPTLPGDELLRCLGALGDNTRLRILDFLSHPAARRVGPLAEDEPGLCLADLERRLALPHPLVWHHVRVLRAVGVVTSVRRGRWSVLRVEPERVAQICQGLRGLTSNSPNWDDVGLEARSFLHHTAHA